MCPVGIIHALLEVIWEDDIKPVLVKVGLVLGFLLLPVILLLSGVGVFMVFDSCFRYVTVTLFGW